MTTGKNNFRFFRAQPRAVIKAARGCEPTNRKLFFKVV
jgi:hypothetical protein